MKYQENYNLPEQLSVDEAMTKFHGWYRGVVGAPNKPAKRGLKILTLADGVTGRSDIYLGCEKQVTSDKTCPEFKSCCIRGLYYTTIRLALTLLPNSVYFVDHSITQGKDG